MALLDTQTAGLRWWEKTIEYMFVRDVLPKSSLAVPLAGPAEAALGDMIFADSTQCRLIEFKAGTGFNARRGNSQSFVPRNLKGWRFSWRY